MSRLLALLTLMFAFTLTATAATPAFDAVIGEACVVMAEEQEAESEEDEEEPDCD